MTPDKKVQRMRWLTNYFTRFTWLFRRQPAHVVYQTIPIDGLGGERTIEIGVFSPSPLTNGDQKPAIIYFHGGGFVVGSIRGHAITCRQLAHHTQRTVISIEYRLAPEHVFPAAAHDAIDTSRWIMEHVDQFGIDASRIILGGDSAGGTLATVATIELTEHGHKPQGQMLFYPITQHYDPPTESYQLFANDRVLPRASMIWFLDLYMKNNTLTNGGRIHPWVTPMAYGERARHCPPTLLLLAGKDVLRDDGLTYAKFLQSLNVAVDVSVYENCSHGYVGGWPGTGHWRAMREIPQWLKRIDQQAK